MGLEKKQRKENVFNREGELSRRAFLIGGSAVAGATMATVFWNRDITQYQQLSLPPTPKPSPTPDVFKLPDIATPLAEHEQYSIRNWDVLFTPQQLAGLTKENYNTSLSIEYEQTPDWKYKVLPAEQIEVQGRRIELTYDSQLINDTPGSPRVLLHGLDLPNPNLVIKREDFDGIHIDKIHLAFSSESEFKNQKRSYIYKPEVRSRF